MRRMPPTPAGLAILLAAAGCAGGSVTRDRAAHEGHGATSEATPSSSSAAPATHSTESSGGHMRAMDDRPEVTDHKWVVQEELQGVGSERLAAGTEATIEADHMPGMKGAHGTIALSTTQTDCLVDYEADGMTMRNDKWVVEDEMTARK